MNPIFGQLSPFFGLSDEAANYILLNGEYFTLERGEVIYQSGSYVDGYYAVMEGEVHLQHKTDSDIKHALWPRKKGHWLAYVHHFAGKPAPADAIAVQKTKLLHISSALSGTLFRKYPELYERVLKDVTKEYVEFAEYHKCTVSNALCVRIARQLLIMALESNRDEITCTHAELATYVGATRKAVGEQLKAMESQSLLAIRYRKIRLSDPALLNEMVFGQRQGPHNLPDIATERALKVG